MDRNQEVRRVVGDGILSSPDVDGGHEVYGEGGTEGDDSGPGHLVVGTSPLPHSSSSFSPIRPH